MMWDLKPEVQQKLPSGERYIIKATHDALVIHPPRNPKKIKKVRNKLIHPVLPSVDVSTADCPEIAVSQLFLAQPSFCSQAQPLSEVRHYVVAIVNGSFVCLWFVDGRPLGETPFGVKENDLP